MYTHTRRIHDTAIHSLRFPGRNIVEFSNSFRKAQIEPLHKVVSPLSVNSDQKHTKLKLFTSLLRNEEIVVQHFCLRMIEGPLSAKSLEVLCTPFT